MNAQEYILSQLEALKEPVFSDVKPKDDKEMADAIFAALMSKKFRKYSVPTKNQEVIRAAIEKDIANKQPIKIAWPFGGYKLWRLEETPETEDLRKWLIRKYPAIQTGLLNFKFQMVSVPTGGQRVFGQDDLMSLQMFNDRFNGILKERDPSQIPAIASTHRNDYGMHYQSESQQVERAISFLNSVEDGLLGYLGKLEN